MKKNNSYFINQINMKELILVWKIIFTCLNLRYFAIIVKRKKKIKI